MKILFILVNINNIVKKEGNFDVANSKCENLLGVQFDINSLSMITFHRKCRKSGWKIHALPTVTNI